MTKEDTLIASNWARYRSNPIRHLGDIAAYTEKRVMQTLSDAGYPQLAMQYSAPLNLLYQRPMRLTELAELLNMSKQLCLQSLQPIKKAGYILQQNDSEDGRAKLISLSKQGRALITDAGLQLIEINQEFAQLLGEAALQDMSAKLAALGRSAELATLKNASQSDIEHTATMIVGMLGRYLHSRLTAKLANSGHLELQLSYAQVLLYVALDGSAMSDLAEYNGVSPQAISRLVKELEQRGYVRRENSSADKRVRNVCFTPMGLTLINDSVAAMTEVEQEMTATIGIRAFTKLTKQLAQLHQALGLNSHSVGPYQDESVRAILSKTPRNNPQESISKVSVLKHFSAILAGEGGDKNIDKWIDSRLTAKEQQEFKKLIQKLQIN